MRSDLLRSIGTTVGFLVGGGALGVVAILGMKRKKAPGLSPDARVMLREALATGIAIGRELPPDAAQ